MLGLFVLLMSIIINVNVSNLSSANDSIDSACNADFNILAMLAFVMLVLRASVVLVFWLLLAVLWLLIVFSSACILCT